MKSQNTTLKILILAVLLINSFCLITAEDYKIEGDKIIFQITSSKEGIYTEAYIYQQASKIDSIQLCSEIRCYGKINPTYNITANLSGDYRLVYYDFYKYVWKDINFSVNGQVILNELKNKQPTNNRQEASQNSDNSVARLMLVTTICKLSNLFQKQEYETCRDNYLL